MRKTVSFLLLLCLLTSCSKSFIQVFDTASTNTQLKGDYFIYETDTVKITYAFWSSKGVMSIGVFNKLDKPLYIDWKNSSFIYNDSKFNYWIEETKTNTDSYYGGYFYKGPLIRPGFTINEGLQSSSSISVKPERITFIPPKSNYYRSQFYLLPLDYYKIKFDCKKTTVARNDNPKKKTNVYSENFTLENTPLKFRNYLAFTFSENSPQFFFIDNNFYLTTVREMDYRHYQGKYIGNYNYEESFKKMTSFFIKISEYKDIETRKAMNRR
jgi:hypothetical protein